MKTKTFFLLPGRPAAPAACGGGGSSFDKRLLAFDALGEFLLMIALLLSQIASALTLSEILCDVNPFDWASRFLCTAEAAALPLPLQHTVWSAPGMCIRRGRRCIVAPRELLSHPSLSSPTHARTERTARTARMRSELTMTTGSAPPFTYRWGVPCATEPIVFEKGDPSAYAAVPGCSPALANGCGRGVVEAFASAAEINTLREIAQRGMASRGTGGGPVIFDLNTGFLKDGAY